MTKQRSNPSRVLRTITEAQGTYNRLSSWYDWLSSSETHFKDQALKMLDIKPGERILEIGCGTGQLIPKITAVSNPDDVVTGIDLSPGMLAVAHQRVINMGLRQKVQLHLGDALALPYPPHWFNAILMTFTLELFDTPEIPRVLAECRRVLSAGGRMSIAALELRSHPGIMTVAYEWFHRNFPAWADCRPIPLQDFLREAGFTIGIASEGSIWGLPVEIVTAFLNDLL